MYNNKYIDVVNFGVEGDRIIIYIFCTYIFRIFFLRVQKGLRRSCRIHILCIIRQIWRLIGSSGFSWY